MATVSVVEGLAESHRAVEASVALLDDAAMAAPSRRTGWSVGLVVASLAGHRRADRSAAELLDDLCRHDRSLDAAFSAPGADVDAPLLRWREVVLHHSDLGTGYDWPDWPAAYVRRDLERMTMQWNSRRPMGLTGLPQPALQAPPARRLAWLLGRVEIESLAMVAPW